MDLLICLGGTGQRVLHNYVQWYLLGACRSKHPLRAVVIDQDDAFGSVQFVSEFFDTITPDERLITGDAAPWVRYQRLNLPDERASVRSLLTGDADNDRHPALGYLDSSSMNQTITKGFYARPCLIPMFWRAFGSPLEQQLERAYRDCSADGEVRVVVTGSVLGGAGGGLLIPVLEYLCALDGNPKISVVLFGEYFRFEGITKSDKDRFQSNERGVLSMLLDRFSTDGSFGLHRCVVLRGDVVRSGQDEKACRHLPSPPTDGLDPFAEACLAVDSLFSETQLERPAKPTDFTIDSNLVHRTWADLAVLRTRALSGIDYLALNSGLAHLINDPLAKLIWGTRLPNFVSAAWEAWIRSGNDSNYGRFAAALSSSFQSYYRQPEYSLPDLFPQSKLKPSLPALRALVGSIPKPPEDLPRVTDQARWAAANLMFYLLRGGTN